MAAKRDSAFLQRFAEMQTDCLAMQGLRCRRCAEACAAGAIRLRRFAGGFARPELDPHRCDGCSACLEACPLTQAAMAAA